MDTTSNRFIIYVDGWQESRVVVLRVDQDTLVECAHSILPPENGLIHATGGFLEAQDNQDEDPVAVVCGGDFWVESVLNDRCMILDDASGGGFLNKARIGAASVVIDNGKTLWVTGGQDQESYLSDTEFISRSNLQPLLTLTTAEQGPHLPQALSDHCLVKVGPQMAIVTGGMGASYGIILFIKYCMQI